MIRCGKYKHFKGKEYIVTDIGINTETLEKMVIYYPCNDPTLIWIRPLEIFLENVNTSEYVGPRFTWIGE